MLKDSFAGYGYTFKNKAFRIHLGVYLFSYTGKDFYATLLPTFVICCITATGGESTEG